MFNRSVSFSPTILYISPHALNQHTLEPNLRMVVWSAINLPDYINQKLVLRLKYLLGRKGVFGGSWDIKSQPFSKREEFQLIDDLNLNLSNFKQSTWYGRGQQIIEQGGVFSHKDQVAHNMQQLDEVFEGYLIELLTSMKREGYRHRDGADYPEAMIGRDGTLIKTAHGTHRLAAAVVTGAKGLFPVKVIGVHRLWLSALPEQPGGVRSDEIAHSLKMIEQKYR